jgi:hypothetical protein
MPVHWPRVLIEYMGHDPLLEVGAATKAHYRFPAFGARLLVHVRDARGLLARKDMRRL